MAFIRCFADEKKWGQWWPGTSGDNPKGLPVFSYNNILYTLEDKTTNSFVITISSGGQSFKTNLNFIRTAPDSIIISWGGTFRRPLKQEALEKDLTFILDCIEQFYSNEENIYGMEIRQEKVVDSLLISTYKILNHPPSAADIYTMIDELKEYARINRAEQTGYPMLNVLTKDSMEYLTRLAIPVNRKLPNKGNISYKWMLGGGNILITEVRGGPFQIRKAFHEMENYVNDHRRVAPAIPFESLVTDRRQQKDTTLWITRVYYPVM